MNKNKYGLTLAEIKKLTLSKTSISAKGHKGGKVAPVLSIEQIFNAKSNFSVVEKIQHLEQLQFALASKLEAIEKFKQKNQFKRKYRPLGKVIVVEKTDDGLY